MANYEDGSYSCTKGIALIAKVLAGQCTMNYSRAAVGSGYLGEDESPKTATEPAGYVMDAKISAVTTPVDGECQVTVQINSSDVEEGFYATGILLYADDPDEGEVPYTYLVLENGPEWIRPASSVVGKLATFDLIAAVGAVEKVTASIDPDAIATVAAVQQMIKAATVRMEIEIPTEGWTSGTEDAEDGTAESSELHVDIAIDGVTDEMIPFLTIYPEDLEAAESCEIGNTVETIEGALRVYAKSAPGNVINASLTLLCASTGAVSDGDGESGSGYVLPAATTTRLGGVKIGDGVSVESDGTISVDSTAVVEAAAETDESAEAMLDEIFETTGETTGE